MTDYGQPSFSISIEEEYQFIDPDSRELLGFATAQGLAFANRKGGQLPGRGSIPPHGSDAQPDFVQHVSSEAPAAGVPVCNDVKEARRELLRTRRAMRELAASHDLKLMAAGAHPFSHWERVQQGAPRYRALIEDTQIIARRLTAFGMYIHIGIEDEEYHSSTRNLVIDVMNAMRYLLPHILCLANASPFWQGRDTGLSSYRSVLLDALPRTGIPNAFRSYNDYLSYVDTLVRTNSIPGPEAIWWDIRPRLVAAGDPADGTGERPKGWPALEIRVCDALPDINDALAVAALIQAIVAWMVELRHLNMSFRLYDRTLIAENKWRAVRYGLQGKLLDFGIEQEVPIRDLLQELLERVDPVLDRLNSRAEIAHIQTMLARGASSDQQRHIWRESGADGKALVDFLVSQTEQSL